MTTSTTYGINRALDGVALGVDQFFNTLTASDKYSHGLSDLALTVSKSSLDIINKIEIDAIKSSDLKIEIQNKISSITLKCETITDFVKIANDVNEARKEVQELQAMTADEAIAMMNS
jgi:hypothetical protein